MPPKIYFYDRNHLQAFSALQGVARAVLPAALRAAGLPCNVLASALDEDFLPPGAAATSFVQFVSYRGAKIATCHHSALTRMNHSVFASPCAELTGILAFLLTIERPCSLTTHFSLSS